MGLAMVAHQLINGQMLVERLLAAAAERVAAVAGPMTVQEAAVAVVVLLVILVMAVVAVTILEHQYQTATVAVAVVATAALGVQKIMPVVAAAGAA